MQNAESDADRGDHNKSEEGVIPLVIACLSTAKFLEPIEEMLYYIPPFIRLFIKWPWLLCVHFRRDRIAGGLVMQIGSDLFCAIGFVGKNSTAGNIELFKTILKHDPIMYLSAGELQYQGITESIHYRVDFG